VSVRGHIVALKETIAGHRICTLMTTAVPGISLTLVRRILQILNERPDNADSKANPALNSAAALFKANFKHSKVRVENLVKRHIDLVPAGRLFSTVYYLKHQGTFDDLELLVTDQSALEERIVRVDLAGLKKRNATCLERYSTSRRKPMSAEMKKACLEYPGNVNQEGNTLGGSKLKSSEF
jgi:hypothetical protein